MDPKSSSSINAATVAGKTAPSTKRPGAPILQNPQPQKKPRVQPREDLQSLPDIATVRVADLHKLCPDTSPKKFEYSILSACFVQLHPGYYDLQHRFLDFHSREFKSFAESMGRRSPAEKQHLRMTAKENKIMVDALEGIAAAALTAGNKPLHGYAFEIQACCIMNLISLQAPREAVEEYIPDARKRLEHALNVIEGYHVIAASKSQNSPTEPQIESMQQSDTIPSAADDTALTKAPVHPVAKTIPVLESTTPNTEASTPSSPSKASGSRPIDNLRDQIKDLEVDLQHRVPLWDELKGIDDMRKILKRKILATQRRPLLVPAGGETPRSAAHVGILLHGPTGTGKSTIPKSFAKRFNLPMFHLDLGIKGSLQGETETKLKLLFEELCRRAPCVLLMDEVESFLREIPSHDTSLASLIGLLKSLWGDLIAQDIPVYIFGTTNSPWSIPIREFSRRFQLEQLVGLPDAEARREILQSRLRSNYHCITTAELDKLSLDSQGYTLEDIVLAVDNVYFELMSEAYEATAWTEFKSGGRQTFVPAVRSVGNKQCSYDDFTVEEQSRVRARDINAAMLGSQFMGQSAVKKTLKDKDMEEHKLWASSGSKL